VRRALRRLEQAGEPLCRADLEDLLPAAYLRQVEEHVAGRMRVETFAAGRVLWLLANRGDCCLGPKRGAEQSYALRRLLFPALDWRAEALDPEEQAIALARRYLRAHAPATPRDLAHFFGARMPEVRHWLEAIDAEAGLLPVDCGGRDGLLALRADRAALSKAAPAAVRDWPLRLLPLWDCLMMAHADKSWSVPAEADRKRIWRAGAFVAATVLARGRVVATWSQKQKAKRLEVVVEPLRGWRASKHLAGVRREAKGVAAHLGLPEAVVAVAG